LALNLSVVRAIDQHSACMSNQLKPKNKQHNIDVEAFEY